MMKSRTVSRSIISVALAGVLVSTYALYVEMAAEAKPEYKALCDIAEFASCSRVLTSEYSKGFGVMPKESTLEIPNCIFGIIFYCIMIFLGSYERCLWVLSVVCSTYNFLTDRRSLKAYVFLLTSCIAGTFDHKFTVRLQLYLAVTSVASSVYLAYLLTFVLRDFCIVCVSTYFINGALVALVYKKDKLVTEKNK